MITIQLTQGQVAIVDDEDAHLAEFKWQAHRHGHTYYACRRGRIWLHQCILPGALAVDHVDGNGLNNQRSNLRRANAATNNHNREKQHAPSSSCYKGVSWHGPNRVWRARISVDRRLLPLGFYDAEQEAALAYDEAARLYFGEFACLNFPRLGERGCLVGGP